MMHRDHVLYLSEMYLDHMYRSAIHIKVVTVFWK